MDEHWTHEMQNIMDELKSGEASLLVQTMLNGESLHPLMREHVMGLIKSGGFYWQPLHPKVGRPKGRWTDWACVGLYFRKKQLRKEQPKKRVIDIEQDLAAEYASNIEDVKRHIRRGKKVLRDLG